MTLTNINKCLFFHTKSFSPNFLTRHKRNESLACLIGGTGCSNTVNPLILWIFIHHKLLHKPVHHCCPVAPWNGCCCNTQLDRNYIEWKQDRSNGKFNSYIFIDIWFRHILGIFESTVNSDVLQKNLTPQDDCLKRFKSLNSSTLTRILISPLIPKRK